jgi:uncharacterized protein YndB with AHSA1/START domain
MNLVETAIAAGVRLPADQPVILLDRLVDAPRKLVWRMYADPAHLVAFWGPHGSTTTISDFDFRVGGAWRMVIRFPAGFNVPMDSLFEEIVEPERIVFRDLPADLAAVPLPHANMRVEIGFDAVGEQTRLTVRVRFPGLADRDAAAAHGFTQPILDSFERLAALLAERR